MEAGLVRQWTHRPLFACATCLILAYTARLEPIFWASMLFVVPLVIHRWSRMWALLGLALGAWSAPVHHWDPIFRKQSYAGRIDVVSASRTSTKGERVTVLAGDRFLELTTDPDQEINEGDVLVVEGEIRPLEPFRREQLTAHGITGRLILFRVTQVVTPGSALAKAGTRTRHDFIRYAESTLSPENVGLVRGMCFSDDAGVDNVTRSDLKDSGTIHILTVSGFQIALLSGAIFGLFRLLPVPRWSQILVVLILLVMYVAACSWHPPAVRSLILVGGYLVAYWFRRQADGLSLLSLAFIISACENPYWLTDPGFQLSYGAWMGIFMFARWPRTPDWKGRAWSAVRATLALAAVTIPLGAYSFGQFSLTGWILNPLIMFVMPVVVGASLLSWAVPPLGSVLMPVIVENLCNFIRLIAEKGAEPSWAVVQVPAFSGWWLLPYYALLLLLWNPKLRQKDD